jgi:hypothetical protein
MKIRIVMNDGLVEMCKEAIIAYFKAFSHYFYEGT